MELQDGGEAFEEEDEADYLQAAGGGAAAAAYDNEKEDDEFRKGGPLVKVRRHKSGGGGKRGGMEDGFPEGFQKRHMALQYQGGGKKQDRPCHQSQVHPKFRILPDDVESPFPGIHINAEVGAGNHHEEGDNHFQGGAVVIGNAFISGGKAAGGNGGESMVQGLQKSHAPEHVGSGSGGGEAEVHRKEGHGRFLDAGKGFGGSGPRAFGVHHFRGAPPCLGEEGHENDDNAQAAQPVGHGPEEKNGRRQNGEVIHHRSAGAGEAGNALHQPVQRRQGAGQGIGNGINEGHRQPGQCSDGSALPGREAVIGRNPLLPENQVQKEGQGGREEEGQHRPPVVEGQEHGKEQHHAGPQDNAGQHGQNDITIHVNPFL